MPSICQAVDMRSSHIATGAWGLSTAEQLDQDIDGARFARWVVVFLLHVEMVSPAGSEVLDFNQLPHIPPAKSEKEQQPSTAINRTQHVLQWNATC